MPIRTVLQIFLRFVVFVGLSDEHHLPSVPHKNDKYRKRGREWSERLNTRRRENTYNITGLGWMAVG